MNQARSHSQDQEKNSDTDFPESGRANRFGQTHAASLAWASCAERLSKTALLKEEKCYGDGDEANTPEREITRAPAMIGDNSAERQRREQSRERRTGQGEPESLTAIFFEKRTDRACPDNAAGADAAGGHDEPNSIVRGQRRAHLRQRKKAYREKSERRHGDATNAEPIAQKSDERRRANRRQIDTSGSACDLGPAPSEIGVKRPHK